MYDSYMKELAVSEARENLASAIDETRLTGEPIYVTRRGKRVAVIVDVEHFERLIEDEEDRIDREALLAARDASDFIPWEEVKAELGLS